MRLLILMASVMMAIMPMAVYGQTDSLTNKETAVKTEAFPNNKYAVTATTHTGVAYAIGAQRFIPIKGRWSFVPGLFWEYRIDTPASGVGFGDDDYEYDEFTDKVNFLVMPLLFRKKLSKDSRRKFISYFHVGPYVALGMFGTSKHRYVRYKERENIDIDETTTCGAFSKDGPYKSRFEAGIDLGFSFLLFGHYEIGTYLEYSLTPRTRDRGHHIHGFGISYKHGGLGVSVGYQF